MGKTRKRMIFRATGIQSNYGHVYVTIKGNGRNMVFAPDYLELPHHARASRTAAVRWLGEHGVSVSANLDLQPQDA